jgi:dihydroflavonol-4-reductase
MKSSIRNQWHHRCILVTGGTGFLGYHLVKKLCAAGARVRTFSLPARDGHPLHDLPIEITCGDIRDAGAVRRAAAGCEIIFHTAGTIAVWGPALATMREIHIEGTRNVIAATGRSTRVVHTSSVVAVGASRNGNVLNEDSPFNLAQEKIDYVHAKRSAERIALDAAATGKDVVVVNPGYLVGPEDYEPSVMGKFCSRVWKAHLSVAAPGGYSLADVRDVAVGHMLAAEHGQTGRRYILGGENIYMLEFMRRLATVAGLRPRAIPTLPTAAVGVAAAICQLKSWKTKREPYPSFQHCRLNRYAWFVSSERAEHELGYNPRPLEETLRDAYEWHQNQGRVHLHGLGKWWMRPAA